MRLSFAIFAAVCLAGALLYTSFAGSAEARQPSEMANAQPGVEYRLTGVVVKGTARRDGETLRFSVRDRKGDQTVDIAYVGQVPDPFREGREVIVTVSRDAGAKPGAFVGKPDSLITKCPSKFDDGKMEWRDGNDKVVKGE
ncbi:MAG: cytochrome c maturation protein CcmE [Solirubrobacteraceae bacterium]|nr:cytochrome c maturation protein CcmE [Solirubrobacteraceae bacterium]